MVFPGFSALASSLVGQPAKIGFGVLCDRELNMQMFSSKVLTKALLLVVVPTTSAIMLAQSPEAPTDSGIISGERASGLSVYKGIPFAAPPVGDLRWRAPAPVTRWAGTRKTDVFAPACMQTGVSMP